MLAAAYGSVSDIEVLWVVVALVGLAVTGFNFADAVRDRKYLIDNGISNGRRIVADTQVYTEFTRLSIHTIFATIGVLAMFLAEAPNSPDQPWPAVAIGVAIRWGLIVSSILLMSQSIALRRMRNKLRGD